MNFVHNFEAKLLFVKLFIVMKKKSMLIFKAVTVVPILKILYHTANAIVPKQQTSRLLLACYYACNKYARNRDRARCKVISQSHISICYYGMYDKYFLGNVIIESKNSAGCCPIFFFRYQVYNIYIQFRQRDRVIQLTHSPIKHCSILLILRTHVYLQLHTF